MLCPIPPAAYESSIASASPVPVAPFTEVFQESPPAEGVCQVAAVHEVAVRTCPEVGAVADDTFTVVVADLSASVEPEFPVTEVWSPVFVPESPSTIDVGMVSPAWSSESPVVFQAV